MGGEHHWPLTNNKRIFCVWHKRFTTTQWDQCYAIASKRHHSLPNFTAGHYKNSNDGSTELFKSPDPLEAVNKKTCVTNAGVEPLTHLSQVSPVWITKKALTLLEIFFISVIVSAAAIKSRYLSLQHKNKSVRECLPFKLVLTKFPTIWWQRWRLYISGLSVK